MRRATRPWIPWDGKGYPLGERSTRVEVEFRDGDRREGQRAAPIRSWVWSHYGGPDDIVAYRRYVPGVRP